MSAPRGSTGRSGHDSRTATLGPVGRFLLRPRWLAGLGLVLLVAVSFVRLGFWQLDRLRQRHAYEALVAQRLAAPPVALADLLRSGGDEESLRYRRVTAEGAFDTRHEVILYGRTQGDQTGNHVLTPLVLDDGTAVAVDRGWVPLTDDAPPLDDAAPPTGRVRVAGVLFPSEVPPGDTASPASPVTTFARVDLDALAAQVPYAMAPAYLLLSSQEPASSSLPRIAPLPDPAASPPHLSYAIQWFTFSTIAVVGFVVLVRREYRRSLRADGVTADEEEGPPPTSPGGDRMPA
jgi:cytochrome oxidase assembly protein ShyY1